MKHLIIIETVDDQRANIPVQLELLITNQVEMLLNQAGYEPCNAISRFNVRSAVDTICEMYGVKREK